MTEVSDCLLKEYCLLKSSSFHAGICSLCVPVYVRSWRRATKNYNLLPETPKNEPNLSLLGHLSHSGDLLLWVGVRRRASCVVRRASSVVR